MKLVASSAFVLASAITMAGGNAKITKHDYVETWSQVAIEQMYEYRIPASITLAQGILESGSGNSELAKKGNNHFGIKCHEWKGKKIYIDDDKKNECFRSYKSAEESFYDHSAFLTSHGRYGFLFDFELEDYKSWAKGLKQAGYATNPKYSRLLIDLIEDLNLSRFDRDVEPALLPEPSIVAENAIKTSNHQVRLHKNGVKYVVAKKGDTFYSLSKEFGLNLSQLYRYNDFAQTKDVLEVGDVVYVQPKKRRNIFKKEEIVLNEDLTAVEVAQKYAVNIRSLKRLNKLSDSDVLIAKGKKVTLQ